MDIQDYKSSLDNPDSRKQGTFSYLPRMDESRVLDLAKYIIAQKWFPSLEHVEVGREDEDYWYMWKLPMFGEKDVNRVMEEIAACRKAYPNHLVRLIGYNSDKQTQGTSCVVHNPADG